MYFPKQKHWAENTYVCSFLICPFWKGESFYPVTHQKQTVKNLGSENIPDEFVCVSREENGKWQLAPEIL